MDDTFDVPGRGGLLVSGTGLDPDLAGVPACHDEATGQPLHILGVDFPTRRADRTILILDDHDAPYAIVGRTWLVDATPGGAPSAPSTRPVTLPPSIHP